MDDICREAICHPRAPMISAALTARIELAVDPELDAACPGRRAARVAITTHDGRRDSFRQPARKGDPKLPLSDTDLDDKFIELAGPVLGEVQARRLLAQLWSLDTAADLAFFGP